MKGRIKKHAGLIFVMLSVLTAGFVLYSVTVYKKDYPVYSSYNTKGDGIKALYLLTGKMGYEARRFHYPARFLEGQAVMVLYRPEASLFNDTEEQENFKEWLLQGNTLIIIPDENTLKTLWIFNLISDMKKRHEVIQVGDITTIWYGLDEAAVCVMDRPDGFLNKNLRDSNASVAFIRALEKIKGRDIFFNEYYHNLQKPAPGIWELIGTTGRLVFIQIMLVLLLIVLRGWNPFGRVRDEDKWMKRPENEALKALSGLYMRMKAYRLVLSNYYGFFIQKYNRFLNEQSPLQDMAVRTLSLCERYMEAEKGRTRKNELYLLVRQLVKIEDDMKKGMKKEWK